MSFKAKVINLIFTPFIILVAFILLLADAPAVDSPFVVEIKSPPLNSTNKTFIMEGVMYYRKYDDSNPFQLYSTNLIYNYDITDIKIIYTYSNNSSLVSNMVEAKGSGYHFTAYIDLSSVTNIGSTTIYYSFFGELRSKTEYSKAVVYDAFTTIVTN